MPAKLKYLRVDKFRHVRPGTRIEFGSQINTFVGKNGSGKTAALDLISALVRNSFQQLNREEFTVGFELVDGEFSLEGTVTNTIGDSPKRSFAGIFRHGHMCVDVQSDTSESAFMFEGRSYPKLMSVFSPRDAGGFGFLDAVRLMLPPSWRAPELDVFRPAETESLPNNRVCTRMSEGVESFLELFARGSSDASQLEFGVTVLEMVLGEGETEITRYKYLGANLILPDSVRSSFEQRTNSKDIITLDRTTPSLAQFIAPLTQYTDARILFTKTYAKVENGMSVQVFANPSALFTLRNGDEILHDQLSFGEKRLLAFLIKFYAQPAAIIVDELGNGMHHAWIERCVELIEESGTQAFLTSQDPLLLDCLPLSRETYGSQHTLVICEITEAGEMLWRNLTGAETDDFFRSLDVGLQHISEIMRVKGLW